MDNMEKDSPSKKYSIRDIRSLICYITEEPSQDTIKDALEDEAVKENPGNIKISINGIYKSFKKSMTTNDLNDISRALTDITHTMNYIGEKYRDSEEEKIYLDYVRWAMHILKTRLDTLDEDLSSETPIRKEQNRIRDTVETLL